MSTFDIKSFVISVKSLGIAATVAVSLLGFAALTQPAAASSATTSSGKRLLMLHDGSNQRGIMTSASTVRKALDEANIAYDRHDITEPGLDEPLVGANYDVNIYHARPVVVVDGTTRIRVMTAAQTPKSIARDAGLTLRDEDTANMSFSDNILRDGMSERMTIQRATAFTFVFYGKSETAFTRARTVGDMLRSKNISLTAADGLSVAADTPITAGMTVKLWRNGIQSVTLDEDVNYPTEEIKDADREIGYREVKTPGVKGRRTVTYELNTQNGTEVSRREINSNTTKQPEKEVVVVGVKGKYTTPSENQAATWNFLISRGFTREQTAGIMGNLMQEHGFNTTGDGLAQWTGSRQTRLRSMFPDSYMTIQSQLDYLWYELSGPYAKVTTNIKAQSSVEGALIVFQNQYERCSVCSQDQRLKFAYNILASH